MDIQAPQNIKPIPSQTPVTQMPVKNGEKEIIEQLFKERDSYKQSNLTQREIINSIHSAFNGDMDSVKKIPYIDPVSIPRLRTEVRYIVPFIFSGNPEIEIEGVGEEDKLFAQIIEKIANFRMQTIPQAFEKIESWVTQSTGVGTSLLNVTWKFMMKDNGDGTGTPVSDEPDLEVRNIVDCYYNPAIPGVKNQKSLIFRSVLPIEQVKNNQAYQFAGVLGGLNRDKVESGKSLSVNPYDSNSQLSGVGINLQKASDGLVEVFDRISNDRIQTVCEGKERLVLRDVANPYGKITSVKLIHEPSLNPNAFEGYGVGQNTLGLDKGLHSIDNQIKMNVALSNNTHFLIAKGANIDKKQLVLKPAGATEVDTDGKTLREVIQPLDIPDIKQGALEWRSSLIDDHKRASGAIDLIQGSASNNTLGQDQIASTYSSNRFELITRRFKQALADVVRLLIEMELKNLQDINSPILRIFPTQLEIQENGTIVPSREMVYQILISPEAQDFKYNITIKGDTTIAKNKDVQIKQLIDAFNIFGQILPPENQMEWCRKILQLRGVDELDKLVPDPQQFAQQQAQMQQQGMPQGNMSAMNGQAMPNPSQGGMMPQQPNAM